LFGVFFAMTIFIFSTMQSLIALKMRLKKLDD